jgi:hypothetical protein
MQPHTSYLVCGTPRCGSTLLCEALMNTGMAGFLSYANGLLVTFLQTTEIGRFLYKRKLVDSSRRYWRQDMPAARTSMPGYTGPISRVRPIEEVYLNLQIATEAAAERTRQVCKVGG